MPPRTPRAATGAARTGLIADGVFKALLGLAYLLGTLPLGGFLGVAPWLLLVTGALMIAVGIAEIFAAGRRSGRLMVAALIAFDSSWVLATVAAVLLWQGGWSGAGELWLGAQAVLAAALIALVVSGVGRTEPERVDRPRPRLR
ncbi:hypothetical protein [Agrococcus baldri]|uniref:Uncharacterized protein n=1 Tax=Agrococcus baldri TaxID=153730 RepID=A0AA87UYS2_9MICO|nr:hypothetical protein [Agrococcus baldri]GEK81557.1 hypothetical protein ABA31_29080 [Agrococcus baldri]